MVASLWNRICNVAEINLSYVKQLSYIHDIKVFSSHSVMDKELQ
jgi:hypothetical protein